MKCRIVFAQSLVRLGCFLVNLGQFILQSLAVMVMRADELVEFSRQDYIKYGGYFTQENFVASGLKPEENVILEKMPLRKGRLILLGIGGGREAIPLAQLGFEITGVDFLPQMLEKAKENFRNRGFSISGLYQEISNLDIPDNYYDVAWLFASMYSSIPTKTKRINMLKAIKRTLRPGGYFALQFFWVTEYKPLKIAELIKRIFAWLTLGNLQYEKGDILLKGGGFIHMFSSEDEVRSEFDKGGFEVVYMNTFKNNVNGIALLRKNA